MTHAPIKRTSIHQLTSFNLLGPNGAEILCQENSIEVNVLTVKPFKGHLYVSGQFDDSNCVAQAGTGSAEDKNVSVSLRIPLMGCGIQKQFLVR